MNKSDTDASVLAITVPPEQSSGAGTEQLCRLIRRITGLMRESLHAISALTLEMENRVSSVSSDASSSNKDETYLQAPSAACCSACKHPIRASDIRINAEKEDLRDLISLVSRARDQLNAWELEAEGIVGAFDNSRHRMNSMATQPDCGDFPPGTCTSLPRMSPQVTLLASPCGGDDVMDVYAPLPHVPPGTWAESLTTQPRAVSRTLKSPPGGGSPAADAHCVASQNAAQLLIAHAVEDIIAGARACTNPSSSSSSSLAAERGDKSPRRSTSDSSSNDVFQRLYSSSLPLLRTLGDSSEDVHVAVVRALQQRYGGGHSSQSKANANLCGSEEEFEWMPLPHTFQKALSTASATATALRPAPPQLAKFWRGEVVTGEENATSEEIGPTLAIIASQDTAIDSRSCSCSICSTCGELLDSEDESVETPTPNEFLSSPNVCSQSESQLASPSVSTSAEAFTVADANASAFQARNADFYPHEYGWEHQYGRLKGYQPPLSLSTEGSSGERFDGAQPSTGSDGGQLPHDHSETSGVPDSESRGVIDSGVAGGGSLAQALSLVGVRVQATCVRGQLTDASAVILGLPAPTAAPVQALGHGDLSDAATSESASISIEHSAGAVLPVPVISAAIDAHDTLALKGPPPGGSHLLPQFKLHVLVVDDDAINRKIAARFLALLGCTTDCVEDGDEIVQALVLSGRPYDAVLLDILMQRSNGLEVCRMLRDQHVELPIIAATAAYSQREKAIYKAAGFDMVLQKPFSRRDLAAALAYATNVRIQRGAGAGAGANAASSGLSVL